MISKGRMDEGVDTRSEIGRTRQSKQKNGGSNEGTNQDEQPVEKTKQKRTKEDIPRGMFGKGTK